MLAWKQSPASPDFWAGHANQLMRLPAFSSPTPHNSCPNLPLKMSALMQKPLCGHILKHLKVALPPQAKQQARGLRVRTMAQQTTPQEHPHTDPRTNEPSEQTPFSTEKGVNQQEYPGYVSCHTSDLVVTAIRVDMPLSGRASLVALAHPLHPQKA